MIRGTKLPREAAQKINIEVGMGIHNRFDVEVVDAATGKIKQRAVGYNVICNQLWTKLLTPTTYFNYIHYGTGTGTPIAADTSLFQFLGYGATSADNETRTFNEDTGVASLRRSIQLAPETAVGATITEVGIAFGTAANNLCTHAMLQDMNGNPISIIKTDTDLINIYATVYLHFDPDGYMNGSVFLGGQTQNVGFMKSICGGYDSSSWPNFAFGSRAWGMYNEEIQPYNDSVTVTKTYDVANKRMTVQMGRMGVSHDNFPMREVIIAGYRTGSSSSYPSMSGPCFQLISGVENGWFPPYRIEGEALGTGDGAKTVFNTAFPFATNPTVYVDGVAVTEGITVRSGLNACTYPNMYMSSIKGSSRPGHILPSNYDIGGYRRLDSAETAHYVATGRWYYFYNPVYETVPITKLYGPYCTVEASTDMEHWTQAYVFTDTSTKDCPAALRNYPFWRMMRSQTYSPSWGNSNHYGGFTMDATGGNVTFDEPPAIGSVITIDYTTSVIPKDENHVLDVTVTMQFSEYTED